jgi:hypothetical protein
MPAEKAPKRTVNLKLDEPVFVTLGLVAAALDTSKQQLIESYILRCLPTDEAKMRDRFRPA